MKKLILPLSDEQLRALKPGDPVLLSGTIYVARDAAHKRLVSMLESGEPLPFDLAGAIIYYAGPCPPKPGQIFNSCGPTTSGRMDKYAPVLYARGVKGAIGKGPIAPAVKESMKQHCAVYFVATGGAGALISKCITSAKILAFEDLGAEALREISVENFPAIVGVDTEGNDIYETAPLQYKAEE